MIFFFNKGRLGNQLFHYAFLLSIRNAGERMCVIGMSELFELLDTRDRRCWHINRYPFRSLAGNMLATLARLRIIASVGWHRDAKHPSPVPPVVTRRGLFNSWRFVRPDYYQSEQYLPVGYKDRLPVRAVHLAQARRYLAQFPAAFTLVFIHVRRGDYLTESYAGIQGLALPPAYYHRAIAIAHARLSNPCFIVLSDDIPYCRKLFATYPDFHYSSNPPLVDFAIMTLAHAAIISNSTFSWWGSKLAANLKLIMSPRYWYGWRIKKTEPPLIQAADFVQIDCVEDGEVPDERVHAPA